MRKVTMMLLAMLAVMMCSCEESDLDRIDRRCADGSERTYFYPDEDWESYDSYIKMVEAVQIPEELLPNLSTAELVELLAECPLMWQTYAFNWHTVGAYSLADRFNGAQELLTRKDNIQKMAIYLNVHKKYNGRDIDSYLMTHWVMEMWAARDDMLDNASPETLERLHSDALDVFEYQLKNMKIYSTLNISTTMHLLLKVHDKGKMSPAIDNEKALMFMHELSWEFCSEEDFEEAIEFCKTLK